VLLDVLLFQPELLGRMKHQHFHPHIGGHLLRCGF
jgi:hypothetical protein